MMFKKGLTIKDWVIASVMFGAVFAMGALMIVGYSTDSGIPNNMTDSTLVSHYSSLDSNLNMVNKSIAAINQPGGLTLLSGFQAFLGATVSIFNLVLGSMGLIPSLFINFASDFGIPSEVTTLFFAVASVIISIIVVFAILNAGKGTGRV